MDEAAAIAERRLTIARDEIEAEMIRAMLAEHDIPCVVRRASFSQINWGEVDVSMAGPREILVDAAQLEAARDLVESPADPGPAEFHGVDTELQLRDRFLRQGFTWMVLVLFGLPLAIAGLVFLIDLLG